MSNLIIPNIMKKRHLHSKGSTQLGCFLVGGMLTMGTLGMALPQTAYAAVDAVQQKESISGTITDANTNEPIVGASVMIQGTSMGAVTDLDGKFHINVKDFPVTLVVTYVGYQKKEVKVTKRGTINISISEAWVPSMRAIPRSMSSTVCR